MSGSEMETSTRREGSVHAYSDDHVQYLSPATQLSDAKLLDGARCSHSQEAVTIRDTEGNALCSGTPACTRHSSNPCVTKGYNMGSDASKDVEEDGQYLRIHESHHQTCCFPKALKLWRKSHPSDTTSTICLGGQPNSKLEQSIPNKTSFETCFCSKGPCAKSDTQPTYSCGDDDL